VLIYDVADQLLLYPVRDTPLESVLECPAAGMEHGLHFRLL
jgi:hypothetical protein